MPICKICGIDKPENEYYKSNKSTCKECKKKRDYEQRVERNRKKAEAEGKEYHPRGMKEKKLIPDGCSYCNECRQILPESEFGWHKRNGVLHINYVCKKCAVVRVLRCPNRKETQKRSNENKEERRKNDPEYKKYLQEIDKRYYNRLKGLNKNSQRELENVQRNVIQK